MCETEKGYAPPNLHKSLLSKIAEIQKAMREGLISYSDFVLGLLF